MPRPTGLTLEAGPDSVTYGERATLRASLVREGTATGLAGRDVRFEARRSGETSWSPIGTARTGAGGVATLRHTPKRNTEYRARFRFSEGWDAATSGRARVRVRPKVATTLHTPSLLLGQKAKITGSVTPARAGQAVVLQRSTANGWKDAGTATLSGTGTFSLRVRPATGGTFTYRVLRPGDEHYKSGVSAKRTVTVRAYVFPIKLANRASYGRAHHDYPATDIFAACGTTVVAATAGRVDEVSLRDTWDPRVDAGPTRGGLSIAIVGHDGVRYYGSHFATIADGIRPGVRVRTGHVLGTVGNTGSARPTPCHLHFGLSPPCGQGDWQTRRGVVYPWPYLDAWKAGNDRSPAREVALWAAANPAVCPLR